MVMGADTSGLVSEPIGQTMTTELIRLVLAAYPKENGIIERMGSAGAIGLVFPDRQLLGFSISPKLPPSWQTLSLISSCN